MRLMGLQNTLNVGFSIANNQAVQPAHLETILTEVQPFLTVVLPHPIARDVYNMEPANSNKIPFHVPPKTRLSSIINIFY